MLSPVPLLMLQAVFEKTKTLFHSNSASLGHSLSGTRANILRVCCDESARMEILNWSKSFV
eukprot:654001-Rhodomonas_salina.1